MFHFFNRFFNLAFLLPFKDQRSSPGNSLVYLYIAMFYEWPLANIGVIKTHEDSCFCFTFVALQKLLHYMVKHLYLICGVTAKTFYWKKCFERNFSGKKTLSLAIIYHQKQLKDKVWKTTWPFVGLSFVRLRSNYYQRKTPYSSLKVFVLL